MEIFKKQRFKNLNYTNMKTPSNGNAFDRTVKSLCREIDTLRQELSYWQERAEKAEQEHALHLERSLKQSQKDLGTAIMFALSVQEDGQGNLVIPSDRRHDIVNHLERNT